MHHHHHHHSLTYYSTELNKCSSKRSYFTNMFCDSYYYMNPLRSLKRGFCEENTKKPPNYQYRKVSTKQNFHRTYLTLKVCCDSQANMLICLFTSILYGSIVVSDSPLWKNKTRAGSCVVL